MSKTDLNRPADWRERQRAVDISRSCIVQAPAGSGKTELLVQRILALLAVADEPEEILSITFTRKAAGEMRQRLLEALWGALSDNAPAEEHARETWSRARSVLARDSERGWSLLQNPSRLQLTTIDSFCAYLTRRMPWMSRFGEQPGVTDDPEKLYREAIERLLSRLEKGLPGDSAIEDLLVHLDNRLPLLRDLLVVMLGKRDQWLRHLSGQDLSEARTVLEGGLSLYVSTCLARAYRILGADKYHELRELALYAAENLAAAGVGENRSVLLAEEEGRTSLDQWQVLTDLALTASGSIRKSVNKNNGFPADKSQHAIDMKQRAQQLLDRLRDDEAVSDCLQSIRKLPATSYDDSQWSILRSLIDLLPLAAYELREVFRSRGVVDFIEIAGAARAALGDGAAPEDLLLQLDSRIKHILVDEFQDTSFVQYQLLSCLTAGWALDDGRTLFLVGDPMQSIYRFREAEVGLYLHVCQNGLNDLPVERIVLNTNFRSNKTIVNWTNGCFNQLFPLEADTLTGAVPYAPAIAFDQNVTSARVSVKSFHGRQDEQEAKIVVELVRKARKEGDVAILVRSRGHLDEIVRELKKAGIRYLAQDIDSLTDRPVVQDILSLLRAVYRPADRVSWLAVLRAPWCGLTLNDLTAICGHDKRATIWELITEEPSQEEMFDPLSADGRARLERVLPALENALKNIGRLSIRSLVESTWLGLGGPACYSKDDLQDAEQVFSLLNELDTGVSLDDIDAQLEKLFAAPAPLENPDVHLMTIHKAKGLEFDTVILPGLGRGVRGDERTLLRWLEHPEYELLLAPIPPLISDTREATYDAIGHIQKTRGRLETVRLLYVAATRAKCSLHLLGHVNEDAKGEFKPLSGSLLDVLWPACYEDFHEHLMSGPADVTAESVHQKMRRLPIGWVLPQMPSVPHSGPVKTYTASEGHSEDDNSLSRKSEEGRIVGIVVHEYLDLIARDGGVGWSEERLSAESKTIQGRLGMIGVPNARLDKCVESVTECLLNTINSQRGKWLLEKHDDNGCELPVNGIIEGRLVHATIDRTFVEQDTCWVIDYKTSLPSTRQDADEFMKEEAERYRQQLQTYAFLMSKLKTVGSVKAALYFPRFDGWTEVDVGEIQG